MLQMLRPETPWRALFALDYESAAQLRRHLQTSLRQSLTYYDEDIEDFRSGRRVFSLSGVR
jgi:hypothetical protein